MTKRNYHKKYRFLFIIFPTSFTSVLVFITNYNQPTNQRVFGSVIILGLLIINCRLICYLF